ncbi:MAG: DUF4177 domain-containing protein [Pseudomonadota bacterium]
MPGFEYKIVPAPDRARKIKGAKGPEARFAATLEEALNTLGADGWEFVRTEMFKTSERAGLTGKKSVDRQVMVFRKPLPEPVHVAPAPAPEPAPVHTPEPAPDAAAEDPPVFASDARGPRILGRPVPPLSRSPEAASEAD